MAIPEIVQSYFPFPSVRQGQSVLIRKLYDAIKNRSHCCFDAANGLGKTVAVLAGVLPTIQGEDRLLIYCARTHSQMERVFEEITNINEKISTPVSAIALKGRREMCINADVTDIVTTSSDLIDYCNSLKQRDPSGQCPYYRKFIAQEESIIDLFAGGVCSSETLIIEGSQMRVCPYELSRKLLARTDVVITTYNYLIHPAIQKHFLSDLNRNIADCIIVFDESHNLPEIAMNANSDYISLNGIQRAKLELGSIGQNTPILNGILDYFEEFLGKALESYEVKTGSRWSEEHPIDPEEVKQNLLRIGLNEGVIHDILELGRQFRVHKIEGFSGKGKKRRVNSSLNKFGRFLELLDTALDDNRYFQEVEFIPGRKGIIVRYNIRCLDARPILEPLYQGQIICMSGTLRPIKAFCQLAGFPPNYTHGIIASPFSFRNIKCVVMRNISTRFEQRTPERYGEFKRHVLEAIEGTPGNVGVFCASYDVMEKVLDYELQRRLKEDLEIQYFREHREMEFTSKHNEKMVQEYKRVGREGGKAVLFGVCGGRNSEGVDFPGGEMKTVVVIGFPLLRPSIRLEALEKFYQQEFGPDLARFYAYTLPAIRKSNQAAGRPIRKLDDRGAIIFLDERFTWKYIKQYLASWVTDTMQIVPNEKGVIAAHLRKFQF